MTSRSRGESVDNARDDQVEQHHVLERHCRVGDLHDPVVVVLGVSVSADLTVESTWH
jgi:hypothetical protein